MAVTPKPHQVNYRYIVATRRYLLIAVGIGLAAAVLVMAVIIPQIQASFDIYGKLSKEEQSLRRLEKKSAELQQVTTSPTFAQVSTVNEVLPSHKPLIELLNGLNSAVIGSAIGVTSIELAPGSIASQGAELAIPTGNRNAPAGDYEDLDMTLTIRGTLPQINDFVQRIEKMSPLTTVTGITLNKQLKTETDDAVGDPFEAKLTVKTYYFAKSVKATLEAPLPALSAAEEAALNEIAQFTKPSAQEQMRITGGGLQDLFGLELLKKEAAATRN